MITSFGFSTSDLFEAHFIRRISARKIVKLHLRIPTCELLKMRVDVQPETEKFLFKLKALKYNNEGLEKYRRVDFDEAIGDYTKAIELDPGLSVAYYNRGTVLYRLGLYSLAISDLEMAVELDPNNLEFSEALRDCQKLCGVKTLKSA